MELFFEARPGCNQQFRLTVQGLLDIRYATCRRKECSKVAKLARVYPWIYISFRKRKKSRALVLARRFTSLRKRSLESLCKTLLTRLRVRTRRLSECQPPCHPPFVLRSFRIWKPHNTIRIANGVYALLQIEAGSCDYKFKSPRHWLHNDGTSSVYFIV